MTSLPAPSDSTPTRRTVLRGAALGGAVLWTAPAVQVVNMTAASAQLASEATPTMTTPAVVPAAVGELPAALLVVIGSATRRYGYLVPADGSEGTSDTTAADRTALSALVVPAPTPTPIAWGITSSSNPKWQNSRPTAQATSTTAEIALPAGGKQLRKAYAVTLTLPTGFTVLAALSRTTGSTYRNVSLTGATGLFIG